MKANLQASSAPIKNKVPAVEAKKVLCRGGPVDNEVKPAHADSLAGSLAVVLSENSSAGSPGVPSEPQTALPEQWSSSHAVNRQEEGSGFRHIENLRSSLATVLSESSTSAGSALPSEAIAQVDSHWLRPTVIEVLDPHTALRNYTEALEAMRAARNAEPTDNLWALPVEDVEEPVEYTESSEEEQATPVLNSHLTSSLCAVLVEASAGTAPPLVLPALASEETFDIVGSSDTVQAVPMLTPLPEESFDEPVAEETEDILEEDVAIEEASPQEEAEGTDSTEEAAVAAIPVPGVPVPGLFDETPLPEDPSAIRRFPVAKEETVPVPVPMLAQTEETEEENEPASSVIPGVPFASPHDSEDLDSYDPVTAAVQEDPVLAAALSDFDPSRYLNPVGDIRSNPSDEQLPIANLSMPRSETTQWGNNDLSQAATEPVQYEPLTAEEIASGAQPRDSRAVLDMLRELSALRD